MTPSLSGLRIVVSDDHAVVRMGFRLLLEGAGANVVGEAESGEAAIAAWGEHCPDLLVMDVSMPGIGGLAALERLLARYPRARVLMLSAHEDVQIPSRALRAGALGYLGKHANPDEFIRAAQAVGCGKRYLDASLAPQLAMARLDGSNDPAESLTDKEFSVFLQLAQGRSVADVAERFHLSPSTVGTHLYHIKQKLNAGNAAELALIAVRAGLIEV